MLCQCVSLMCQNSNLEVKHITDDLCDFFFSLCFRGKKKNISEGANLCFKK